MDLMPSPDQEQIIHAAHAFLAKELPVQHQRWEQGAAVTRDRALLPQFAELGWIGLGIAEEHGGAGFGPCEEMFLFREAGRFLVTPILLAQVIAARLVLAAGMHDMAPGILACETRCGLAIQASAGRMYLIDAEGADLVVHVGDEAARLCRRSAFRAVQALRCLDDTVTLEIAEVEPCDDIVHLTGPAAAAIRRHISLLIAAMLAGSAEALRDLSVAHATERVQFGQKIGTFQAVSHKCADMALRCEAALSQAKFASILIAAERSDADYHVHAARIVALDAALSNAASSVQLHGGMGFAAEYPVHFFLKRARLLNQIGDALPQLLDQFLNLDFPGK